MDLELTWDSRHLAVWRGGKVEGALTKALTRAGNDALRGMRVESGRQVRDRKRFKVAKVRAALPLDFPRVKSISDLVWRMRVSGAPSPVSSFSHRQTRKGVTASINAGQRTLIKSAFIARMNSGHVGVFVRTSKKSLPIRHALTTRVSDVFRDAGIVSAVHAHAQGVFQSSFKRLLSLELGKLHR